MIRKAADIRLKVLPIGSNMEHLYYYEGPCRFGKGDALKPGYDRLANAQAAKEFYNNVTKWVPSGCDVLNIELINGNDTWKVSEEQWERLAKSIAEADVIAALPRIGTDQLFMEMIERFNKPVVYSPTGICAIAETAALRSKPEKSYQLYPTWSWENFTVRLAALRAAKIIKNTTFLLATRFGSTTSFSSVDSFNNYDLITSRLGAHFRFINAHELLDQMDPMPEGGNHTTPGRDTLNITEDDMKEIEALADELLGGAKEVEVSRKHMINSLKAYQTVKKLMDFYDCNAFSAPCPDICSTRRLNQMQFTFCLTHSLLTEQGIPSACEFDVSCAMSEQALIAVSGMNPYMGNAYPVRVENGKISILHVSDEDVAELNKDPKNLYSIQHSVPHRRMKDPNKNAEYSIRHFAQDQEFGAIFRYDWKQDIGQVVTTCRFSPDGGKLFIGRGTIVGGGGYKDQGCSGPVIIRVRDHEDFFEKQCNVGMHLPIVYGDVTEELKSLADVLGIEAITSI